MIEVGKVYRADLGEVKIHFAVLDELDVCWAVNITSMKGLAPGCEYVGKALIFKHSEFTRHSRITEMQGSEAADPVVLADLIDMALDTKDEAWFKTLTEQKKKIGECVK